MKGLVGLVEQQRSGTAGVEGVNMFKNRLDDWILDVGI